MIPDIIYLHLDGIVIGIGDLDILLVRIATNMPIVISMEIIFLRATS